MTVEYGHRRLRGSPGSRLVSRFSGVFGAAGTSAPAAWWWPAAEPARYRNRPPCPPPGGAPRDQRTHSGHRRTPASGRLRTAGRPASAAAAGLRGRRLTDGARVIVTKEHRRFAEVARAVCKQHTIGICHGPAGVGKTLSARRYARWDSLEPYIIDWARPQRRRPGVLRARQPDAHRVLHPGCRAAAQRAHPRDRIHPGAYRGLRRRTPAHPRHRHRPPHRRPSPNGSNC